MLSPVVYIPHGGGPRPVLGAPDHQELADFLRELPEIIGPIKAILVISAHWEEDTPTVMTSDAPGMLYDYYGFPPESYELVYPAAGSPALAAEVEDAFVSAGLPIKADGNRDFDHGSFIPLMLMYPEATLPVFQLSLSNNLDPAFHLAMGKAIQTLRSKGVLILGSGLSFHNLRPDPAVVAQASQAFDDWLQETLCSPAISVNEREQRMTDWEAAPWARFCHPREEHLLPLHVCLGAAGSGQAEAVYQGKLWDWGISGYLWR